MSFEEGMESVSQGMNAEFQPPDDSEENPPGEVVEDSGDVDYEEMPAANKDGSPEEKDITEERRHFRRKSLRLNKIFVGEVGEDYDVAQIYLYIVDISEGGMRITCDMDLPMDYVFHMNLNIDVPTPLDTDIKIVWKKELFGGTKLMGVQFVNPPESVKTAIAEFMEKHSAEGKRRAFRLERVLPVEIEIEGKTETFNTLTMDLSTVGMKISNPFPLPFDKPIRLKLMLDFDEAPVYLKARVAWQKETSYGQHIVGIEFTHLRGDDRGRINLYIDRAISGELDHKVVKELPADLFDFPIKKYKKNRDFI